MRRRAQGFTLIEIMVVIAIIAGLVTTVAIIVPQMQERQKKVGCQSNLSQLGQIYLLEEQENKSKAQRYSGVAMWLSYRRMGPGMKIQRGNEKVFICPGDAGLLDPGSEDDKKQWDAPDLDNPPDNLCSYAGRDFKGSPMNVESADKEIVGSDRQGPNQHTAHHRNGLVVVFSAGDAPFLSREELNIPSDVDIAIGPEATNKDLKKLAYVIRKHD